MSAMDYIKNAASSFLSPIPKRPKSPTKPDSVNMNPNPEENTYKDLNRDGPDPLLKPKKTVNFFNPDTRDISRDKHGHYVSTMTYPLPPVNWEKRQHELNKKKRNAGNKYL